MNPRTCDLSHGQLVEQAICERARTTSGQPAAAIDVSTLARFDQVGNAGRDVTRSLPSIRTRIALLTAACAALAQPTSAAAVTIHVDSRSHAAPASCGSEAAPCETIADAIDHATGGEVVLVAPGHYEGATLDVPVTLRGAQSGVAGPTRGIGTAARTSTIRGTLLVRASATIDGFEFTDIATGPALRFGAPVPEAGSSAPIVVNNTFSGIGGTQIAYADAELAGLTFAYNLFLAKPGGAHVALFAHGELVTGGIDGVLVERNEFRGFTGHRDAAALDAGGVSGLRVRRNTVVDSGPLLVLSDTDGASEELRVQDNVGTGFVGPAIRLGGGVDGLTIERNRLTSGTGTALHVSDERGTGRSRNILVRANDISGFHSAIDAGGDSIDDALVLRGNRIVIDATGDVIANSTTVGKIDARLNWWGHNTGLASDAATGLVDASEPLRLVGVDAPGAVFVGGSGVVSVRLVGASGSGPATEAAGFPVTFASTNATLDATQVTIGFGTASALFTADTTPGTTTTTATLDGETVSATTRILAMGRQVPPGPAEPSVADGSGGLASRFVARIRLRTALLGRALSDGITQFVGSSRPASVRTTFYVTHHTAKKLGLRPRTSPTHEPFVIGKARTRAVSGARSVTVHIRHRPRFAIARYGHRVEVFVVTHVRTKDGVTRTVHRRFAIPASVR